MCSSMRELGSYQVQKSFTACGQKLWTYHSLLTRWEESSDLVILLQKLTFIVSRGDVIVDTHDQYTGFKTNTLLFWSQNEDLFFYT